MGKLIMRPKTDKSDDKTDDKLSDTTDMPDLESEDILNKEKIKKSRN